MTSSLFELLGWATPDPDTRVEYGCCDCTYRYADGPGWIERPCAYRRCVDWSCPYCGTWLASDGPVGCLCKSDGPNPLPIDGHAYRRRTRNR